jgi:hypothetical protein
LTAKAFAHKGTPGICGRNFLGISLFGGRQVIALETLTRQYSYSGIKQHILFGAIYPAPAAPRVCGGSHPRIYSFSFLPFGPVTLIPEAFFFPFFF